MIAQEAKFGRDARRGVFFARKNLLFGHISLALFICLTFMGPSLAAIPLEEREALIALYWATDGENWGNSNGWLGPPGSEGGWEGVQVEEDRVVALNLNGNIGLKGNIPPEIGNLTFLRFLNLGTVSVIASTYYNEIESIPEEIGQLIRLEYLDLNRNRLRSLPDSIGKLENLRELNLVENPLVSIPPSIGNLANLTKLYLSDNDAAIIPPTLGNLTRLEYLSLGGRQLLAVPPEIGQLQNLDYLRISLGQVESLPPTLGNLANLRRLALGDGSKIKTLPPEIGNLTQLQRLSVVGTTLEYLPAEIGHLENLEYLYLLGNRLREIPSTIGLLDNVDELTLTENQLRSVPAKLGDMKGLERLKLGSNLLASLPNELERLDNLTWITIDANRLSTIPVVLGRIPNLSLLSADENQITSIPPEVCDLANWVSLSLESNLIAELPSEFVNLQNLVSLDLGSNRLKTLPAVLAELPNLGSVSADNNQISRIDPQIGNAPKLRRLFLASNQIADLPSELAGLKQLETLDLNSNRLTKLPSGLIGALPNLTRLYLSDNEFAALPFDMSEGSRLGRLELSNNRIAGQLPPELGALSNLRTLRLEGNRLTGKIPDGLLDLFDGLAPGGDTSIRWNGLYTDNPDLKEILENFPNGEFEPTQTVAPEDIIVQETTGSTVELHWSPISFTEHAGGYDVFFAPDPEGPYIRFGITSNKFTSKLTVTDLEVDTTYYFVIRSVTFPHENNKNTVRSEFTEPVSATTEPVAQVSFPVLISDTQRFTGFALSNLSGQVVTLDFHAYDNMGIPLPAGKNPTQTVLNPGGQLALSAWELFQFDRTSSSIGWVDLTTDNNRMGTLFQLGSVNQLDGARALTYPLRKMYFTRVIAHTAFLAAEPATARILIANPNPESITLEMTLISNEPKYPIGAKSVKVTWTLPPKGMLFETIEEVFGPSGFQDAYIQIDVIEGKGAVGLELIESEEAQTLIALSPLQPSNESTHLFSAQLASGAGMFTSLKLLNTSTETREVTLRAVGDNGENLAEPVVLILAGVTSPIGSKFMELDVSDLYELPPGLTVGSLHLETDGPGVVGDVVFGDTTSLEYAAALPLQCEGFTEAVFSHVANNSTIYTGLAFYNPGTETAEITLEVFARNGSLVGTQELQLEQGKRLSRLLPELVPASSGYLGGYVVVRSSQPIIGQQLFGDYTQTYLSASPPTIRAR